MKSLSILVIIYSCVWLCVDGKSNSKSHYNYHSKSGSKSGDGRQGTRCYEMEEECTLKTSGKGKRKGSTKGYEIACKVEDSGNYMVEKCVNPFRKRFPYKKGRCPICSFVRFPFLLFRLCFLSTLPTI